MNSYVGTENSGNSVRKYGKPTFSSHIWAQRLGYRYRKKSKFTSVLKIKFTE
jgi:hypothetical protein